MKAGCSKVEIEYKETGHGMMGYGRDFNIIKGYLSPVYTRAFCFETENDILFYVNLEICLILPELKHRAIEIVKNTHPSLPINAENVMITAQHTHSAPGGYSHFAFYNWPVPGFRPALYEAITNSIAKAIIESHSKLQNARIKFGQADFEEDEDVAFQRSLNAYNRNPENRKYSPTETHLAIERSMHLLRVEKEDGSLMGSINWFGVHTTSLGNRVYLVSGDNKGFAAQYLEEEFPGSINIFAQQFAADVSPNFHGKGKKWKKGKFNSDIKSAEFNGELQYKKALEIINSLKNEPRSTINSINKSLINRDFSNLSVDPEFMHGQNWAQTGHACHGAAFLRGTPVDGKGSPEAITQLGISIAQSIRAAELSMAKVLSPQKAAAITDKYNAQDPKNILMEPGIGRILGTYDIKNLFIPGIIDGGIMEMKRQHRIGAIKELPWTPSILPLQFFQIGEIAIIGFPGEITTTAGRRLRELALNILSEIGIQHVIVSSYANSYFGYCTTYHEYFEQDYEGGHNVFGKWTFDAFRTEYKKLLEAFVKNKQIEKGPEEQKFSQEEIEKRTFKEKKK